jgi:thiol:disulfide interchange protein/DsbC/DsbD-like thiol-disulfide interchange protein
MRVPRLILVLSALLAAGLPAWARPSASYNEPKDPKAAFDADHLRVELLVPESDLYPSDELNYAGLYFKLEPGWHIYWKNPGDAGLPPHIQWTLPKGITAGPIQFPAPKRLPLGPLMDFGYENEVLFPLKLHVANSVKGGHVVLRVKVDWLVCRGSCIPGKAELEMQRNVHVGLYSLVTEREQTLDWRFFERNSKSLPEIPKPFPAKSKAVFQTTQEGFRLAVETGKRETEAAFFPEDQDILDNPAPQKLTPTADGLILDLKKDVHLAANPGQLRGVLELSGGRAYELAALPGTVPNRQAAEAGQNSGTVAELLPAGAKAQSNSADSMYGLEPVPSARQAPSPSMLLLLRTSGLAFIGGLLLNLMPCVFPVLFLKGLALVNSGSEERHKLRAHGLVYAAGIVVSFWALVAVLLGLRAAGATLGWGFQFQSPVFLALMAGLLFFLGLSLAGQFEIGLTLTSAGGSLAAKQGYAGSFFTGVLAVVVATPCTAPFMGAAIGYALSAPAAATFAVFTALALGLAAPYVALTLQPAWTRLLPRPGVWMEILRQAISVPIFLTVIWLAWVLAQAYGAGLLAALLTGFLLLAIAGWFLGRWPARRWATVVAAAILLAVAALCVLAPKKLIAASETLAPPETNGPWQPWSQAAVNRSLAAGQPVFVDFTASWCLSCQVNERVALNRPETMQAFEAGNVVLLKADWTRHDEAITQALTALGRSGVPAYALYVPGETSPQLLPEVLTPGIVTDALSKLPKTMR